MKITVMIPCHNEELLIKRCIYSILYQTRKADQIIVVNDGSTDNTLSILKKFKNKIKIINLPHATGNKSYAQEAGLESVTGDILITTDADTILDEYFIENILKEFKGRRIAACAGYVKSFKQNWLTSCRQIEYIIGQEIHKKAQSKINAIFVIPGCAAAYRTKIFKNQISFDHDTLTEDLDFTYKYHRNDLKISFCKDAIVYTQDPTTISDYIKQLRRWHAGNWQNLIKHFKILGNPSNALEISLVYMEGLVFPLIILLSIFLNFKVFLLFSLTYVIIISLFAILGVFKDKRWDLLAVIPLYYFVSFINYFIFFEQFIKEFIFHKKNLIWFQPERKAISI